MLLGFLFHSQHCCLANAPQIYNFFLNVRVKSGYFVCFSASSLACEGGNRCCFHGDGVWLDRMYNRFGKNV